MIRNYHADGKLPPKKSKSTFLHQSPVITTRANSLMKVMETIHISDNDITLHDLRY